MVRRGREPAALARDQRDEQVGVAVAIHVLDLDARRALVFGAQFGIRLEERKLQAKRRRRRLLGGVGRAERPRDQLGLAERHQLTAPVAVDVRGKRFGT